MPRKLTSPPPLGVLIKRHILLLNNELPPTVASIWVTSEELHQRLIHTGVRKSLTLEMVQDSLRRNNTNMMHLNVHHQDGKTFYRSAGVINNDLPLGQRKNLQSQKWKRVNYCPNENYFTTSSSTNLTIINTALKELEDGAHTQQSNNLTTSPQLEVTPVKTYNSAETQTEPLPHFLCQEIDDYDGLCFMSVEKMDNFIREIASHAAQCGMAPVLVERKTHYRGTMLYELWRCPCCGKELPFTNQTLVKTDEVADGAKFSRLQPYINVAIAKGAKLTGINMMKLAEFLEGHLGIRIATENNLRKMLTKVNSSIEHTFLKRCAENRKEHVAVTRADPDYIGDLIWEKGGVEYSTCQGEICIDGAGCTRSYNHRHKGRQTAFIVNSRKTGKPLALVVSSVSIVTLCLFSSACHSLTYSMSLTYRHHV